MGVLIASPDIDDGTRATRQPHVHMAVLLALGLSHLFNDTIQSLIPAMYPILAAEFREGLGGKPAIAVPGSPAGGCRAGRTAASIGR